MAVSLLALHYDGVSSIEQKPGHAGKHNWDRKINQAPPDGTLTLSMFLHCVAIWLPSRMIYCSAGVRLTHFLPHSAKPAALL